jgi:hypothetical protein
MKTFTIKQFREALARITVSSEPSPMLQKLTRLIDEAAKQYYVMDFAPTHTVAVSIPRGWWNQPRDAKGRFAKRTG